MYLEHHGSQQNTDKAKNILFYALWALYALTAATNIIDIIYFLFPDPVSMDDHGCLILFQLVVQTNCYHLGIIVVTLFACCDFIAQSILVRTTGTMLIIYFIHLILQKIYRCWIVWGYSIRVVIVPSFLAFAFLGPLIYLHSPTDFNRWFLAIWIAAGIAPISIVQGLVSVPTWSTILAVTGLTLSMTVNALVTGIFKVFQEVKTCTADDQILGVTGGTTLRRVIFILIESGAALFSIQLARLVVTIVNNDNDTDAYSIIYGIHQMLNVIMSSVIAMLFY